MSELTVEDWLQQWLESGKGSQVAGVFRDWLLDTQGPEVVEAWDETQKYVPYHSAHREDYSWWDKEAGLDPPGPDDLPEEVFLAIERSEDDDLTDSFHYPTALEAYLALLHAFIKVLSNAKVS